MAEYAVLRLILLAAACASPSPGQGWRVLTDSEIVAIVQSTPACAVDNQLPNIPLDDWFRTTLGADGNLRWVIAGGCDEMPSDEVVSEYPLCVSVEWSARRQSMQLSLKALLQVGSSRGRGRAQVLRTPELMWFGVASSAPHRDSRWETSEALADLPAKLKAAQ